MTAPCLRSAFLMLAALTVFAACPAGPSGSAVDAGGRPDKAPAPDRSAAPLPGDWPQARGPRGDGVAVDPDFDPLALQSAGDGSADHPRLLWKRNVGWGYAGTAVSAGRVYTLGFSRKSGGQTGTDTVYCLAAETGGIAWTFSYPGTASVYTGPRAFPLVRDGLVYTVSWDGKLFCLDALTGRKIWFVDVQGVYGLEPREQEFGFCSPPVIAGETLLLNARAWGVAFDRRTGRELWKSPAGMSGYAPPALFVRDGRELAAVFGADKLYVVDSGTGAALDSFPWKTAFQGNIADPIVHGNDILVSSSYGRGFGRFRFDGKKLSLVYRVPGDGAQTAPGVVIDGYYYGNDYYYYSNRGENRCLDLATGKVMWGQKLGQTAVVAVNKTLLVLLETGELIAAEATSAAWKPVARTRLGKKQKGYWLTPPVAAHSRLYVRNYRGDVLCLDAGKRN